MMADSCRKEKTHICVTANLHVGLSSQSIIIHTASILKQVKAESEVTTGLPRLTC